MALASAKYFLGQIQAHGRLKNYQLSAIGNENHGWMVVNRYISNQRRLKQPVVREVVCDFIRRIATIQSEKAIKEQQLQEALAETASAAAAAVEVK